MSLRVSRLLFAFGFLFATVPAALDAQEPLPADSAGRVGWPVGMTPRQHIAVSTFFGGTLGAAAGVVAGWGAAQMDCPPENREVLGCTRPSDLPRYGVALGTGTGAWWAAARAGAEAGCRPAVARRRARRGAIRGFVVGVAPLLAYHAAGGDDARVGWTLAVGGSALQVASIAHATAGCLDRR